MSLDLEHSGVRSARIVTLMNPIDPKWVSARLGGGDPAILEGRPRLLAIGRLEPQKGFDVLITSLPAIRSAYPELHLTIIGAGRQEAVLKRLVAHCGLGDCVTFVGSIDNPFPYYEAAELLIAPSRWEGLSNVVIEALMAGLPVVTTTGPAAGDDLILSDEFGRLVHPEDVDGLTAAVCDAIGAEFDRPRIRTWAAERFGSDQVIQAYGDLLWAAGQSRGRRDLSRVNGPT